MTIFPVSSIKPYPLPDFTAARPLKVRRLGVLQRNHHHAPVVDKACFAFVIDAQEHVSLYLQKAGLRSPGRGADNGRRPVQRQSSAFECVENRDRGPIGPP